MENIDVKESEELISDSSRECHIWAIEKPGILQTFLLHVFALTCFITSSATDGHVLSFSLIAIHLFVMFANDFPLNLLFCALSCSA
jgi:hypothetical protein